MRARLAVAPAPADRIDRIGAHIVHPAAAIFPLMVGAEYRDLVTSVRRDGLLEPIELLDGQVLDGRNRYRACLDLALKPAFRALPSDTDAYSHVMARNMARRHLEPGQRAAIWLEHDRQIQEHADQARQRANAKRSRAAHERPRNSFGQLEAGLPPTGRRGAPPLPQLGGLPSRPLAELLTAGDNSQQERRAPPKTRELLAKRAGVSPRTAQKAITVHQRAPELHRAVVAGDVTLERAFRAAKKRSDQTAADLADEEQARFHETSERQFRPLLDFFHRSPELLERWLDGRWVDPCAGAGALARLFAAAGFTPPLWTLFELRAAEASRLRKLGWDSRCPADFLAYKPAKGDREVTLVTTNLPWPEPGLRIVAHAFECFPAADVLALCELNCLHLDWAPRGQPRQAWIAEHQPDYLILPGRGHPARALAFEGESSEYNKPCAWLYWPAQQRNRRRGSVEVLHAEPA